jgi:hypothetical protein
MMTISVAGAAGYFPAARLHQEVRQRLVETVGEIERGLGQRMSDAVELRAQISTT